jgi:hypothetical protein
VGVARQEHVQPPAVIVLGGGVVALGIVPALAAGAMIDPYVTSGYGVARLTRWNSR